MRRLCVVTAAVAAMAIGAITPHVASAGHWWWTGAWPQGQANPTPDGTGRVVHLARGHLPSLSFFNNAVNGTATALEHARADWSNAPAIDVWNWSSGGADIVAWDGNWCTPWSGLATPGNGTGDGQHYNQGWVQINTCSNSYASGANYRGTRAVACQEIGHIVGGMSHEGPSCMGFGYQGAVPAGSNWLGDDRVLSSGAHDRDHLWHLWNALH